MSKVITVDLFDSGSIDRALAEMLKNKDWVKRQCWEISKILASMGADAARETYGDAGQGITVTVKYGDTYKGEASVVATGQDVCFVEFGTGVYADPVHELAGNMPFDVMPGSWSDTEGKHTWSRWFNSGRDVMEYPFNSVPRRGMLEASKTIQSNVANVVHQVFK